MAKTDASSDGTTMSQDEARHLADAGALSDELQRRGSELEAAGLPSGGLNLIGLFADILTDQEIDEFTATIYAARWHDVPRDVHAAGWVA